jgi:diguanylate cyclase (GGDEF)-like protein
MFKDTPETHFLLEKLCKLSDQISDGDQGHEAFDNILKVIIDTMRFNVGILYEVYNHIDNILILKIITVFDLKNERKDVKPGLKLKLDLNNPNPIYINECKAYAHQNISTINVPGIGCDLMSYINTPDASNGTYLFGGDFIGEDARVSESEVNVCKIINNLLSSLFFRKHFETQAIYDGLTKLYNSQKIKNELQIFLKRLERQQNQSLSIVLADIDYFKKLNDNYSHIQGDSVLEEVGLLIKNELRTDIDIAGRYGGEEFLLILLNTNSNEAVQFSERMRNKIASHSFKRIDDNGNIVDNDFLNVTMSFGIASLSKGEYLNDSKAFIAVADKALYQSKHAGRNKTSALKALTGSQD